MKDLVFNRPQYFYILFIPFVVFGAITLLLTHKPELFLYFNQYHSPAADIFFIWNTWLGNGIIFASFCIFLFIQNKANGILSIIIFTLSAVVPQLLKKLVFPGIVRPAKYFEGDGTIYLVEGIKHHSSHSFPSGHSVSIFALALLATLVVKNKAWGLLFAFIAIITAYSRVYLAQHFFEDIYAGACIGVLCTLITFLLFEKSIRQNKKLNRGLFGNGKS